MYNFKVLYLRTRWSAHLHVLAALSLRENHRYNYMGGLMGPGLSRHHGRKKRKNIFFLLGIEPRPPTLYSIDLPT